MSVESMSVVLHHSRAKGSAKLLLEEDLKR